MQYIPPLNGDSSDENRSYWDFNPATGLQGAIPRGIALEHPMREILAVISGAGLTPSGDDLGQLWQAIRSYVNSRIAGIDPGGGEGGTVDLSDYYTKVESNDRYYTQSQVNGQIASALLAYYTKVEANERYYTKSGTASAINAALEDYYSKVESNSRYYTQSQVNALIAAVRQVPVGQIAPFGRETAPAGWLKCNGLAVSRTTYADLFAEIGETFGEGDGATTFSLPDLRGNFVRGWANGISLDPGRDLGSLQEGSVGAHSHGVTGTGGGGADYVNTGPLSEGYTTVLPNTTTGTTASDAPVPRNIALLYCIKF